ncbi:hypothetical protein [Nostoc sp. UHCC 0870]|uniref:hypothetical protein n=1 Tax=Nostoc sp. UHCC 0870 TaxID=2914041 RepID=UPI001EDEA8DB|nr:hypothetical protein [Nostoc sp. UHCC 0870]
MITPRWFKWWQFRVMPNASSCWFIQVVAVASSVSIARFIPVLEICSSFLHFAYKTPLK